MSKYAPRSVGKKKTISVRFSEEEMEVLQTEVSRLQLNVATYIRSSVLMRLNGELVDKEVSESEMSRRNITLRKLDKSGVY
tara:strand:- start:347 stop:589 length:243 start_codon:yes stop_codon:yes gene_type:complete